MVGPTHPCTGGIVHHTTELAHRLDDAAPTDLVTWTSQFPARLYPGDPLVPCDRPEVRRFPATRYVLSWCRPDTWWRQGRRLRNHAAVVLVVTNPLQVLPYRVLLAAAGPDVLRIAVVHNVVPHEPRWFQVPAMRRLLSRVDRVVVHSTEQAALARTTGAPAGAVWVAALAPHFPGAAPRARSHPRPRPEGAPVRLLSFGTVRRYKGLDLLLEALVEARTRR